MPELGTPQQHAAYFYGNDERLLASRVCQYLCEGWQHNRALLLITTPEHFGAVELQLDVEGVDPHKLERESRLLSIDARDAARQLLTSEQPHWGRFETVVGTAARDARSRAGAPGLRAYGEIVGLFWSERERAAAMAS